MNLKRLRTERGLSQQKLSKLTGVSRVTIARLEGGTQEPHLGTVQKLANGLGLEPRDVAPELFAQKSSSIGEMSRKVFDERMPTIRKIAHKHARDASEVDDLESAGLEGLYEAWRKFDPNHGTPFDKFSNVYIAGRIKDQAAKLHDVPVNRGFENESYLLRTFIDAGVYDDDGGE